MLNHPWRMQDLYHFLASLATDDWYRTQIRENPRLIIERISEGLVDLQNALALESRVIDLPSKHVLAEALSNIDFGLEHTTDPMFLDGGWGAWRSWAVWVFAFLAAPKVEEPEQTQKN